MTESNGGTTNQRSIRPDDVLVGFDPDGTNSEDLTRSNTLREVASTLAADTNMAVGQALNKAQTAADAAVKTSGDQTIEGVKTFTSIPILPDANPTGQNDAVRKKYVDDVVQGLTEWEVSVAYTHPVMVTGSDGNPYVSVQDSTGIDPATDDDESHWKRFGTSAQATESVAGIVELADDTETQTGTDGEKAVTPAGLASVTSTETRRGLVELATQEEADAGTDTERAMTPALVKRIADNIGPPPFHVPAGSACVDDCDDAPLGWSTPAVGAANLPAEAQGGEGDMIGCWQVAQTADPHGDSATSSQEELMQLYVSADGAGSNEGIWFRVRDGSFTNWTSLISPPDATEALAGLVERATQAEADAGSDNERYMTPSLVKRRIDSEAVPQASTTEVKNASNVNKYVPPDLLSQHPGVAVAWGRVSSNGTLDTTDSYNVSSTSRTVGDELGNDNYYQGVVYTINLGITMASSDYSVIVTCRGSDNYSNANDIRGVRLHNSNIGVPGAFTTSSFKVAILGDLPWVIYQHGASR